MARVDDLLTEARADLPSAPDFSIKRALKRSAQRFFQQSGVWREALGAITLQTGKTNYSLPAPSVGARAERLLNVLFDTGTNIVPVVREQELFLGAVEGSGPPQACALRAHTDEVVVWPAPSAAENGKQLRIYAVIVPGAKTESIPNPLLEEWGDGIVFGAKAEMMSMPAMPWTNTDHADDYERRYNDEVLRAKREATSGSQAPLRVKPVRFC